MRRLLSFRVLVGFLGSVAAALAAGRATAGAELSSPSGEALQVLITTAELVVGQNRFAFGLLKEHQLLEDAHAVVRVYTLEGRTDNCRQRCRHLIRTWRSSSRATVCTSIRTGYGMCTMKRPICGVSTWRRSPLSGLAPGLWRCWSGRGMAPWR